jgi:pimeloyl-ACP methyl ester carboxylesterase
MAVARLDEREEHFFVPLPRSDLRIFLRLLRTETRGHARRVVLYVHGASFPSALSVAYRFDGRSWRDALCDAGFDVWGLDFLGFGQSDRYPEMDQEADSTSPLGLAADAAEQIAAAVSFILTHQGIESVSIISHSWGSMPAGLFAGAHPTRINRLVCFAPISWRAPTRYLPRPDAPSWRIVTTEDQWSRFTEDVPPGELPVLSRHQFVLL